MLHGDCVLTECCECSLGGVKVGGEGGEGEELEGKEEK